MTNKNIELDVFYNIRICPIDRNVKGIEVEYLDGLTTESHRVEFFNRHILHLDMVFVTIVDSMNEVWGDVINEIDDGVKLYLRIPLNVYRMTVTMTHMANLMGHYDVLKGRMVLTIEMPNIESVFLHEEIFSRQSQLFNENGVRVAYSLEDFRHIEFCYLESMAFHSVYEVEFPKRSFVLTGEKLDCYRYTVKTDLYALSTGIKALSDYLGVHLLEHRVEPTFIL
ncbi:hypothetical protein TUMSATVNIG3_52180 [Vibrio nigripulchritudo]|nr:hypothetical protein TUMSATVNIG2_51520 [Vibrio nigripulchritudo]BDU46420.1 hypothetical protein TUMSATVNIG3_52180 [Vibrio nigripulchritudo]